MRRREQGVSLLEMLLVVALVAATSLVAVAAFGDGFRGVQLRSAAKEVAAQLRFTRTRAIAIGQPQRFEIDPGAQAWRAPDGHHGGIPGAIQVRFYGARQAQPADGIGAIVFFPDGAATGGRIRLGIDQAAWQVNVAWLTGDVTVGRVDGENP